MTTIQKAESRLKFKFPYDLQEWIDNGMVMENYHKHTTWSNLVQIDSATSIDDFIRKTDSLGAQCYFSTEHGYPGEWLYCYDICKQTSDAGKRSKMGISKPIRFRYGAEVYWVKDIGAEIEETYTDKDGKIKTRSNKDKTNCHMVLIARNYKGIRKINYIISCAHQEGYYYKPRIDLKLLFTLDPEDVYVTSACIAGHKYEDDIDVWLQVWKHFGDSFFFEYQTHNTDEQAKLNKMLYEVSQKYGIQTIVGLDTHYISDEDCIKRDNLFKRKGIRYDEENGWYLDYPDGPEVFRRLEAQKVLPEEEIFYSMMNTQVFINGCEELQYDNGFKIPILKEFQGYSYEERCKLLQNLLNRGYLAEDADHKSKERIEAIRYEFGEIKESGCVDYFIDNYVLVNKAVKKYGGQLTTTSRGSASSYYCSKLLGFTTLDRFEAEVPIFPERFITKDRILTSHQMPD